MSIQLTSYLNSELCCDWDCTMRGRLQFCLCSAYNKLRLNSIRNKELEKMVGERERGKRKDDDDAANPASTQNATKCEKDNKISFPMADSDCHAPPCRHSFSADFAQCVATPYMFAHRITLHHFRFYPSELQQAQRRILYAGFFSGSGLQPKTCTNRISVPTQKATSPNSTTFRTTTH